MFSPEKMLLRVEDFAAVVRVRERVDGIQVSR